MPERVLASAILGGVAPSVGPDAAEGGAAALTRAFEPLLRRTQSPLGGFMRGLVRVLEPFADVATDLFARVMPAGDQRIFEDLAMRRMFQQDLILGSRRHMQ